VNADGLLDIADPVYLLGYRFGMGAPPPPPFPDCGEETITTSLECATVSCPP